MGSRGVGVAPLALALATTALLATAGDAVAGSQCGKASWYGLGGRTANGERVVAGALSGAHPTLPFGTQVKVENLSNGRAVVVRINDRGPFTRGRVIDVSKAAAEKLGMIRAGVARVRMTVVDGEVVLKGSCRGPSVQPVGPAEIIAEGPMPEPRERPPNFAVTMEVRFSYAFLPDEQTVSARRAAAAMSRLSSDP